MKKMLVAVDGSERERGVLNAAVALAQKTGAKLVLFRSIGMPHGLPPEVYAMPPSDIPGLLEKRATIELEQLASAVPAELRGGVRVHLGIPWEAIQKAAQDEDADLIVIGSHGYSGLDRVIGTTAAKVVNHADRAVLVVRAPERLAK